MELKTSLNPINDESIGIEFRNYEIKFKMDFDIIYIIIFNTTKKVRYKGSFSQIEGNRLFGTEKTGRDLVKYIIKLIEEEKIKLIDDIESFKIKTNTKKEFELLKTIIVSKQEIVKKMDSLKNENKILKEKISIIEKNINEMEKNILMKQNDIINKQIIKIKEVYEEKINKMEQKIKRLEEENKNKIKIIEGYIKKHEEYENKKRNEIGQRNKIIEEGFNYDLKFMKTINAHDYFITSVSVFPLGNIISVSDDKSIKIWDINFNLLQNIKNAHEKGINYVDIKDENNFVTCSEDRNIKTWIKKDNKFELNKIIKDAHEDTINKVIYSFNGNIISCSDDKSVKIWELSTPEYKLMEEIIHSKSVKSIFLLKDKKILISVGNDGIKFWNLNNFYYLFGFNELRCNSVWYIIERIDENIIIVGNENKLNIISLLKKEILNVIDNKCNCNGIKVIKDKGIFLISEYSHDIKIYKIYKSDNYKCIKIIKNAHENNIIGFSILKNNLIASYSFDRTIKIWEISEYDYI